VSSQKKTYFASDIHLGLYPYDKSREREKKFVRWLNEISADAEALYLLGDVFDYWYEYKKVVPRGFVRTLAKLAEFSDLGIPVHFFTGNHDVWVFDYLPTETGVIVHREPLVANIRGKKFFLDHGDGLGPGDHWYKIMKRLFDNRFLQWMFSRLHPNGTIAFGHWWSKNSRYSKGIAEVYLGEDKEFQILFAKDYLQREAIDYFIFGHRHIPMDVQLSPESRLVNLGEWIFSCSYAVFDGTEVKLLYY
jgi:UDP-2,3-diacylglucosamine hydrolase